MNESDKILRVALIQSQIHWEDIEANLAMFAQKIGSVEDADLIVLPEMFSTGFTMNAVELAEEMNGPTMQWMARMAKESGAQICGSLIMRTLTDDGRLSFAEGRGEAYNRLVWMRPDGTFEHYDKRHLFSLAREEATYTPGRKKLIVRLRDWRLCPQICYDLRFPVWSRNAEDYDVLINVANWPEKRSLAWRTLLRARAIENQCYVVGVNRIGEDGRGVYHSGDSAVIDPMGETLWERSDEESIQTVTLSRQLIYETRRKFPFLKDRDEFDVKA